MNYELIFELPNGCIDYYTVENALNEQDAKRIAGEYNPSIIDRLLQIVPTGITWTIPAKNTVQAHAVIPKSAKKYSLGNVNRWYRARTPKVIITDNHFRISATKWLLGHKFDRLINASLPTPVTQSIQAVKMPVTPVFMRDHADKSWIKAANNTPQRKFEREQDHTTILGACLAAMVLIIITAVLYQ